MPSFPQVLEAAQRVRPEAVVVLITGYPALNHEEFVGLARDTSVAGTLSFLFVLIVLFVPEPGITRVFMQIPKMSIKFG